MRYYERSQVRYIIEKSLSEIISDLTGRNIPNQLIDIMIKCKRLIAKNSFKSGIYKSCTLLRNISNEIIEWQG